jgi:hypothetical protein
MFLLLLIAVGMVALLSYLTGTGGLQHPEPLEVAIIRTNMPPLPGTPIAPYAQLDPAIIEYLQHESPAYYGPGNSIIIEGLPPIGAYLARSGEIVDLLAEPTVVPTPFPYATSPPLPLPYTSQTILPTLVPAPPVGVPRPAPATAAAEQVPEEVARTLPNVAPDGASCAPSGLPVGGVLTQRYHRYHSGIDLGVPMETPVVATHSGIVTFAGWSEVGYGYLVIVQSGTYITYYAHNSSFNVTVGQSIGKFSVVAWSGSSGNSSGPHVHYETRINDIPVDPLTFESRGLGTC